MRPALVKEDRAGTRCREFPGKPRGPWNECDQGGLNHEFQSACDCDQPGPSGSGGGTGSMGGGSPGSEVSAGPSGSGGGTGSIGGGSPGSEVSAGPSGSGGGTGSIGGGSPASEVAAGPSGSGGGIGSIGGGSPGSLESFGRAGIGVADSEPPSDSIRLTSTVGLATSPVGLSRRSKNSKAYRGFRIRRMARPQKTQWCA